MLYEVITCFNILQETDFIISLSEVGVIILMFAAGLETDIKEFKKTGKASLLVITSYSIHYTKLYERNRYSLFWQLQWQSS